jgi:mRNA-degrading endonuclease toxin of MazEF toxin-antitoxin module
VAEFVKGDVVVVPFPFSDLAETKRRPALVLSRLDGDDLILCQITSRQAQDRDAIPLEDKDFAAGGLRQPSNVRPNRIFTADRALVLYRVGNLKAGKLVEVIDGLIGILRR